MINTLLGRDLICAREPVLVHSLRAPMDLRPPAHIFTIADKAVTQGVGGWRGVCSRLYEGASHVGSSIRTAAEGDVS
jgi:hypothetical protein